MREAAARMTAPRYYSRVEPARRRVVVSAMPALRTAAVAAVLALAAPAARADVAIGKGTPPDRALADGALAEAGKAMAVCWRVKPAGPIKVAIAVAGDGAVTAKALTKGNAAQCAAGILAVWSIPGGAWKGEVEIGATGAASPDLATAIQQQLAARSAPIKACQQHAPGKAGNAAIKMKIATDGHIGDVAVASKLGDELDKCVARAVAAIALAPTGAAGPVAYQLSVAFSGKADATPPAGDPAGGAGAPSIGGGLSAAQVEGGLKKVRERIGKCVDPAAARGKHAVVRFTIRTEGTPKNIVVKESSGDPAIDACVEKGFVGVTFPTAGEETKVSLPLGF